MSNYFGTGLDQAPLNEQLGEAAYWDLKQLYDVMFKAPKIVSGTTDVKSWDTIGINTSSTTVTVTLPYLPDINDRIQFFDAAGTWDVNNAIIERSNKRIMGVSENLTLDIKGGNFTLIFSGDDYGWVIL